MHRLHSLIGLFTHPTATHLIVGVGVLVILVSILVLVIAQPAYVLFSVGVGAEIFSGYWKDMGIPVPLDRVFIILGLGVMIWSGVRYRAERRLVWHPIHVLMLMVVVYAVCSALWAHTLLTSLGGYAILDRLGVVPYLMFTVAPLVFRDRRARNALLVTLVVVGLYLGFVACLEGVGLLRYVEPAYIRNPNLGIHYGRARGPFLESVADGLSMFMCSVAAAVAMRSWRRISAQLLCAAVMVLSAAGIIFTLTRTNWLAAAAGTIVAMACDRRLRRRLPAVILIGAAGVIGVLVAVPGLSTKAGARAEQASPVWDRYNTNDAALRAWESHPVFGIGWEKFETVGPQYLRQANTYPMTGAGLEVHNVFLSHLVELGVPGVIMWSIVLFTGIGGAVLRRGPPDLRDWRLGLIAIFIAYLISANLGPMSYPLPNLLMWLWTGIVAADFYSVPRWARPPDGDGDLLLDAAVLVS